MKDLGNSNLKIGMTKVIASLMLSTALLPVVVSKADAATSGTKTATEKARQVDTTNEQLTNDQQNVYVQTGETSVKPESVAVSTAPLKAVEPASDVAGTIKINRDATTPVAKALAPSQASAASQVATPSQASQASQASAASQSSRMTGTVASQSAATSASSQSATSAVSQSGATSQSSQVSATSATSQSSQASATSATSQSSQASANSASSQSAAASQNSQAASQAPQSAAAEPEADKPKIQANHTIGPGYYDDNILMSSALYGYQDKFFSEIKAGAIAGWRKYGVLPSITAAQAILESGWGRSQLSTQGNNLFGIKGSYNGQSISFPTQEWRPGGYYTVYAAFRKYPNWSASVEDHGRFLDENSRYRNLIGERDYQRVARLLQSDGYATAPDYASSLINMVNSYGLQSWDREVTNVAPGKEPSNPGTNNNNSNNTVNNNGGRYVFKAKADIHTEASMNSAVVGTYDAGESVNYTGKVDAGGYTWLKYQSYSGRTHYIAISGNGNQNNNNQNNNNNGGQNNVIAESGNYKFTAKTNIRSAASKSAQVVGTYNAGESVRYNGKVNADGLTWLKYVAYSGATHYVAMNGDTVQTPSQPVTVPASGSYRFNYDTAIKTAPQTNAQTVGTYRAGETVYYNGKVSVDGQTWLRYQSYSGAQHYVAITGNNSNSNSGSQPVVTPQSGSYRFNGTTAIKSAPDNNAQTVGTYYAGNTVYYNGKVTANGQTWLRYQSYSGAQHYVAISGNANNNQAPAQTIAQSGTYRFTMTTAIKSAPNAGANTVGSYGSGETVYYNGKVIANGQTWLKYQAYSGATHYVSISGVAAGNYQVTNSRGAFRFTNATAIHNAPSMSAGVVGRYNQGETVYYNGTVRAEGRTWLKYQSYSGATHYVPR